MPLFSRKEVLKDKALASGVVCKYLDCSKHNLKQWVNRGELPSFKHGSKEYFYREDIFQFKGSSAYQAFLKKSNRTVACYICSDSRLNLGHFFRRTENYVNKHKFKKVICEEEVVTTFHFNNQNSDSVVYLSNLIYMESLSCLLLPCEESLGAIFLKNLFNNLGLPVLILKDTNITSDNFEFVSSQELETIR